MYRILELNPQLKDFAWDIDYRMELYRNTKARILADGQTLNDFANAHHYYLVGERSEVRTVARYGTEICRGVGTVSRYGLDDEGNCTADRGSCRGFPLLPAQMAPGVGAGTFRYRGSRRCGTEHCPFADTDEDGGFQVCRSHREPAAASASGSTGGGRIRASSGSI